MNPMARPTTPLTRIGSSGRNSGAMTITNSGTDELRIAASGAVDGLLRPGDQRERQGDVDQGHDDEVAVDPPVAGQRRAAHPEDDPQERGADQQPQRDQREGPERVDGELDEEVRGTPHEAEGDEEDPLGGGGAVGHGGIIAVLGLPTICQVSAATRATSGRFSASG